MSGLGEQFGVVLNLDAGAADGVEEESVFGADDPPSMSQHGDQRDRQPPVASNACIPDTRFRPRSDANES